MQQNTEIMMPFGIEIDLETGAMPGATNHIKRKASNMKGYYQDTDSLERIIADGDPLHYEVLEHPVPEVAGHLMYCISKLYPGTVGRECFMTKGHYHTISDTAEIYLCLRGEGQMLMKTAQGRFDAQPMRCGVMVYVPPLWAHRSVNTGDEPLVSFCVYPADAGHNYGDIEAEGFPSRVFLNDGEVVIQ